MKFDVEGWDPSYGPNVEEGLVESTASVDPSVELEADDWRAIGPTPVTLPAAMLFVDGVRRVEARVWITGEDGEASHAICASYAAGVVCCCSGRAHLIGSELRRGLFTTEPTALDISTTAGSFHVTHTAVSESTPVAVTLSQALQRRLAEVELIAAVNARAALDGHVEGEDLLVIDGPLYGRQHLPRAVGFIKSHRTTYLPPPLNPLVGMLAAGERTPVFLMGTSWDRYAWYLRLPCRPGAPWAGIARLECSPDLPAADAITLAYLSQVALRRFASTEVKDPRAPQNLYPIGGLERELRRRLGDPRLLYRALRVSAQR